MAQSSSLAQRIINLLPNGRVHADAVRLRAFISQLSFAMTTARFPFLAALALLLTFSLSGCDAIGTIFKAGAWTGVIGVFLIVVLLWFVITRIRR